MVSHVRARWIYLPLIRSMKVLDHCTWSTLQDPCLTCEEFPPLHPIINRVITLSPRTWRARVSFLFLSSLSTHSKAHEPGELRQKTRHSEYSFKVNAHGSSARQILHAQRNWNVNVSEVKITQNGGILKLRIVRFHFAGISSKQNR